jgi:hypothetical protein
VKPAHPTEAVQAIDGDLERERERLTRGVAAARDLTDAERSFIREDL